MPKYVAKTYGRRTQKDTGNRAFDDIFSDSNGKDGKPSTAMATGTMQRWGKASFTSTRNNAPSPEPIKRKAEEDITLFDDPFSFESEEDSPSRVKKNCVASNNNRTCGMQQQGVQTNFSSSTKNMESDILKKPQIRTYSRTSRGGASAKPMAPLLPTRRDAGNNRQTTCITLDSFTKKSTVLSDRDSSQESSQGSRNCPMVRKFFTSRLSDHNYSSSQASISEESAGVGASKGSLETNDSDDSNFDFDSDQDLESGDPEIIFNSPKKRRAQQQARLIGLKSGEESPITVSSEASEASTVKDFALVPDDELDKNEATKPSDSSGATCKSVFSHSRTNRASTDSNASVASSTASNTTNNNKSDGLTTFNKERVVATYSRKLTAKFDNERKDKKKEAPVVRRLLSSSPRKSPIKAVYNPRQWVADGNESSREKKTSKEIGLFDDFDELDDEQTLIKDRPSMKRTVTWPTRVGDEAISSLRVSKQHKELFTVVRNVKQAHECQEHGETQEFDDDIEYIMDGLGPTQNIGVRCLSTVSLVTKCAMPAFRMHLRAHGTLAKIFCALQDSPKYPTLALCTAAVLYMMSRDRLNMDLEKSTLELMLELLSVSAQDQEQHPVNTSEAREFHKLRQKIQGACHDVQKNGATKHFELEDISTGHLAMESLLTLTSKRAGDWFKEELRTLGGLDHIIDSVATCIEDLDEIIIEPTDSTLDRLLRVDRCLRVLENVTFLNSDNQSYLISYKSAILISSLCRTLKVCENCLPFNEVKMDGERVNKECPGFTILSCMLSLLRVLLNLTHDNEIGSRLTGKQDGLVRTTVKCVLHVPQFVPVDQRFDLSVLSLGLLINMMEHCDGNRNLVINIKTAPHFEADPPTRSHDVPALEALTQLFVSRFERAQRLEEEQDREREAARKREKERSNGAHHTGESSSHDDIDPAEKSGEWRESESGLEWVVIPMNEDEEEEDANSEELEILPSSQDEDENFTKALHKAGRHMEDSIVAAYVSLLVGCIVQNNSELVEVVRQGLPNGDFYPMILMLKKFLGFMNLTTSVGNTGGKSIQKVIDILEAC